MPPTKNYVIACIYVGSIPTVSNMSKAEAGELYPPVLWNPFRSVFSAPLELEHGGWAYCSPGQGERLVGRQVLPLLGAWTFCISGRRIQGPSRYLLNFPKDSIHIEGKSFTCYHVNLPTFPFFQKKSTMWWSSII